MSTQPFPSTRLILVGAAVLAGTLAACSGSSRLAEAPAPDSSVVATYGDEVLTIDTFEERYARSVGSRAAAADDSLGAYAEFLDRYVNFRLKVLEAEAAGLADAPSIQQEIATYRTNLARPYLLEQEVLEPIIRDLFQKQQEIVDVSHILIRLAPEATPADTAAAYARLQVLADSAAQGVDFGDLAFRHSEDPSARGRNQGPGYRGRLGYFSAGRVVEEFEEMAYTTPVGQVSPVFRTQYGYHILQVHDRRPAMEEIHVAHIMIRPQQTAEDTARARTLLDDLKTRLDAGEDFATLARQYSNDRASAENGGDLGFIGYDMPVPAFRDAAYALAAPGDVSDIVETRFGFHLIKLLERRPRPTLEEAYSDLKTMASRLPRAREAETELARQALVARGATVDTAFVLAAFADVRADSVIAYLVEKRFSPEELARPFFTIGDSSYTLDHFGMFARQARYAPQSDTRAVVLDFVDQFTRDRAINYEAQTLETRDEEFRRVMDEFRDGLVLFKLMEDSVWTAAERDSAGLRALYDADPGRYQWPERIRIIGLHARTDSVLALLGARLDAGTPLATIIAEITADTLETVRADTVLAAGETGSLYDQALALTPGAHTPPVANRNVFALLIHDGVLPAGPKTFEEARPEIVTQYQQHLEDRLIEGLRRRYNARTYPGHLVRAFEDERAGTGASASSR